jgi:hypothetical protein
MVTAAVLMTALIVLAPASACPGPTHATVDVWAVHGPVDIATDMTLAQIAELANRTGRIGRHPPLGFYIGGFGYTAITDVSVPSKTECSEQVRVTVTLMLVDRHIEIGKELKANPCLFSLVRDHYRRHAASDDAALAEFARTLEVALQGISLPPLEHDPALAEADRRKVEESVTSAINRQLDGLDAARANARDQVDTDEEVEKLKAEQCRHV